MTPEARLSENSPECGAIESELAEYKRRLAIRDEELEAAVTQLVALERSIAELQAAFDGLRVEVDGLREERSALVGQLAELSRQNEGMSQTLAERDRASTELRQQIGGSVADGPGERARGRGRSRLLRGLTLRGSETSE